KRNERNSDSYSETSYLDNILGLIHLVFFWIHCTNRCILQVTHHAIYRTNVSLKTRQKWVSVIFTNESRFILESDPGRVLIWREQVTRYHQSNIVERFSYRDGGIMVWAGISSVRHTDFHELHGGNPTADALRDIERKSPIHMSEHMLVLLVKNSSSSMIMLDLAELRLVRDILRIKLQQEAGVTAIRRLNIFLPDSLTTLVPGEVEKWETDWAAHPSECPTEEQISLEDGGGITSGTRIYTDDSKAEKGVVAAFCVWSE
ncbi:hypothetical protein AVEN_202468-1, partial [Araneus ventricosus]